MEDTKILRKLMSLPIKAVVIENGAEFIDLNKDEFMELLQK